MQLDWCFSKKKLKVVEPNDNLSAAYLGKADRAILAMRSVKGNFEWEISAAYYAMYCAVYSLMMKVGVKSEAHSCTIAFCRRYLRNVLSYSDIRLLESAKEMRERVQYYLVEPSALKGYPTLLEKVVPFCLKCREAARLDLSYVRKALDKEFES